MRGRGDEALKYYVVSDVHGYFTHLKNALDSAGFFEETEPSKLIVCGDLLDRGEEARELAALMKALKDEGRLIYILGNHEQLLKKGGFYSSLYNSQFN